MIGYLLLVIWTQKFSKNYIFTEIYLAFKGVTLMFYYKSMDKV